MADCAPGADAFIDRWFHDCVYNLRDYIGFCLGLSSILFWIVAQLPQYISNYKNKSAEALSPWFLAEWLLGDTFNLLGALLQGQQLPTTLYTAMYFVVADVFMMMQYIYYGALQRRREKILQLQARRRRRHHHHHHHHPPGSGHSGSSQQGRGGHDAADPQQRSFGSEDGWPAGPGQQGNLQRRQQQPSCAPHDMERGGSDSKQHHLQLQQQQQQYWQPEEQQQPPQQQQRLLEPGNGSQQQQQQQQLCSPPCSPRAPVLPTSCSSAAAAAAAAAAPGSSAARHGRPGLVVGGVHLGGTRSVAAVGLLVSLGLVSLLLPAHTSHTVLPGAGAGVLSAAAGGDAAVRAMHAGPVLGMHSLHATNSSSSSSSSSSGDGDGGSGDSDITPDRDWGFIVGTSLGYMSSVLYLMSRFSQIHKNWSRKSSEGLALSMFMMAVCANMCTGSGILMRTFTLQELLEQLPWIIGSLGTIMLDMVILWQSRRYKQAPPAVSHAGGGEHASGGGGQHQHQHQHRHSPPARPGHASRHEEVAAMAAGVVERAERRQVVFAAADDDGPGETALLLGGR